MGAHVLMISTSSGEPLYTAATLAHLSVSQIRLTARVNNAGLPRVCCSKVHANYESVARGRIMGGEVCRAAIAAIRYIAAVRPCVVVRCVEGAARGWKLKAHCGQCPLLL